MQIGLRGLLARFPVRLPVPDLAPFLAGNLLPGAWSFGAARPGPHVVVTALVHGNEIAGAIVLADWLRQGLRPEAGRLSLVFANLDAFARFDPDDPTMSRFVEEDLNRLWAPHVLDGPRSSLELARARELRPLMEGADVLLDLHSMLWPSDPLMLVGRSARAQALALSLGTPAVVVADDGHADGLRLIDYPRFRDASSAACALLVEGGAHWEPGTPELLDRCGRALLRHLGLLGPAMPGTALPGPAPGTSLWRVTRTVTARRHGFAFTESFRGGTVIPRRNTLIALDGEEEIRTPHDDCLLVMPSPRVLRGHTAVRLAARCCAER